MKKAILSLGILLLVSFCSAKALYAKSFEDYLKMELVFFYDDDVDPKLTPENEEKNKDKGIRRNIKKTMEKDKNFNEILDGLKVESVKFMKKNET